MEADWEIEIGGEAPIIDACWRGFVDLRSEPERVRELSEVRQLPALSNMLVRINGSESPVWTAKCDVWSVDDVDRFELDAPDHDELCALACYVDLLPRSNEYWASDPEMAIAFCKNLCVRMRSVPVRCCRVDLAIRRAVIVPGAFDLGITAYLMACGVTEADAVVQLESALAVFADSVLPEASTTASPSKLQ
jgi:hypothetical protein